MQVSLKCPRHDNQPLDFICLAAECEHKGTVCYLCRMDLHQNHEPFVSLKIFLGQFLKSMEDSQELIKQVSMIDQQLLSINQSLLKLKKRAANQDVLEQAFIKFWKQISLSISLFDVAVGELRKVLLKKDEELVKDLNKWINQNFDKYITQENDEIPENLFILYLKGIYSSLEMVNNQLKRLTLKVSYQDYEILNLLKIERNGKAFRLKFSQELKGTCMTVFPNKAEMTTQGNQRMLLLQPQLGVNKSVKKWRIKIIKLQSWIGIGVSHLDSIKSVNFDFSYTNANHGNYLISSNGYSWNGYKMEFNSKYQTFQYGTGDIVQVTYQPLANKVTFKKQGNQSIFSYEVDPNQKPIHAAINLTGIGDSVQILY